MAYDATMQLLELPVVELPDDIIIQPNSLIGHDKLITQIVAWTLLDLDHVADAHDACSVADMEIADVPDHAPLNPESPVCENHMQDNNNLEGITDDTSSSGGNTPCTNDPIATSKEYEMMIDDNATAQNMSLSIADALADSCVEEQAISTMAILTRTQRQRLMLILLTPHCSNRSHKQRRTML
jgi:hypothetical protein